VVFVRIKSLYIIILVLSKTTLLLFSGTKINAVKKLVTLALSTEEKIKILLLGP